MSRVMLYGMLAALFDLAVVFHWGAPLDLLHTTRWYVSAPVLMLGIVSHGMLAVSLWSAIRKRSMLGQRKGERKSQTQAHNRSPRQKTRARAYINPWHNV